MVEPQVTEDPWTHGLVGGVQVEILSAGAAVRSTAPCSVGPRVVCTVQLDPALPAPSVDGTRELNAWVHADAARLTAETLRCHVRRVRTGQYAAAAAVGAHAGWRTAVSSTVAKLVVSMEGGVVLHAASAELDGRAVLFVGPSGAGKTTACNLVRAGRAFSVDRIALLPGDDGWTAGPLPGGRRTELRLPDSDVARLPVGAVLRVRRGDRPAISLLDGASAVAVLRESAFFSTGTPTEEVERLARLHALASGVTVGEITTVLDEPIDELVGRSLWSTCDG